MFLKLNFKCSSLPIQKDLKMAQRLENIKDTSKNHNLQVKLSLLFKKSVVNKFCRKEK